MTKAERRSLRRIYPTRRPAPSSHREKVLQNGRHILSDETTRPVSYKFTSTARPRSHTKGFIGSRYFRIENAVPSLSSANTPESREWKQRLGHLDSSRYQRLDRHNNHTEKVSTTSEMFWWRLQNCDVYPSARLSQKNTEPQQSRPHNIHFEQKQQSKLRKRNSRRTPPSQQRNTNKTNTRR